LYLLPLLTTAFSVEYVFNSFKKTLRGDANTVHWL